MSEFRSYSRTNKIAEFLLRLQEDSKLLVEFNTDPDSVMIEAGISTVEDRDILKSGDIGKIRDLLEKKKCKDERSI